MGVLYLCFEFFGELFSVPQMSKMSYCTKQKMAIAMVCYCHYMVWRDVLWEGVYISFSMSRVVPLTKPRHLSISEAKSSGHSLVKSICSPVTGWTKPRVRACSA